MITRCIFWFAFSVFIVALVAGWRCWRQAGGLAAIRNDRMNEIAILMHRLTQLQENETTARSNNTAVVTSQVSNSTLVKESSRRINSLPEIAESRKKIDAIERALLTDPELQVLYQKRERARFRADYALLFRRLGLGTEQQKALTDALLESRMHYQDINALIKAQGVSRDDPAIKAQRAEAEAQLRTAVEAVLGPDGMSVLRDYSRLSAAQQYTADFAATLSRIGSPLSIVQLEQLVHAIADTPGPKQSTGLEKITPQQWDQIATRARTFLTPLQSDYFETTTPPGVTASRWSNAASDLLTKTAGPR